jgi:hypothetical protein
MSNKENRGFERERDKLPEDIAPLALTWQRGTSMESTWRVDSQDLQEQARIDEPFGRNLPNGPIYPRVNFEEDLLEETSKILEGSNGGRRPWRLEG